ncbi:FHA domain-containing protein [Corallococcus sp. bb12-1]|uniref:FHA domain-containing protein n=1 Tax=Corallococcus sp. bb12-1 TaxID=2996784 RepID=UPI00226DE3B7|nr:FHA domain-containing protein [Corallococcus sp. bb12-1]MCY1045399.1 FHA domain-containing protein [Corallococcus sp. bb12-1]
MAPPNPKRPPRPPRPPGQQATKDDPAEELPFDDDEVAPLQADDPRPQRVPQYPAGSRKVKRRGPGERSKSDRELSPRYDWQKEYSEPGLAPAFLYVERGPGAGQLVPLHQGSITLGRSSTSDLRLQHASISRRHAQLTRRGNTFAVRDLGSQNGTFVNRSRIKGEVEIRPGDELSLGNAMLRLRGSGAPPMEIKTALDPLLPRGGKRPVGVVVVALAAAVVGSAVAALISLVAMSMTDASPARTATEGTSAKGVGTHAAKSPAKAVSADTGVEAQGADPSGSVVPAAASGEPATGMASPLPGSTDGTEAQRAGTASAKAGEAPSATDIARGLHAPAKAGETPGATDIARGQQASTTSAKGAEPDSGATGVARDDAQASRKATSTARKNPVAAATTGSPDESAREAIITRYESGDVSGALTLARRANLAPLVQHITRFQAARDTAQSALDRNEGPRAIDALSAAVRLDQEIAHGWSTHGAALRRQLAGLYLNSGKDAVRASRWSDARAAFTSALKHDDSNAEARAQLAALEARGTPSAQ